MADTELDREDTVIYHQALDLIKTMKLNYDEVNELILLIKNKQLRKSAEEEFDAAFDFL